MIKYINLFKKNNKIKYISHNTKNLVLICDRGRPGQIYFNSLFALNLNKKKKYNIIVLSEKKVKSEYNRKLFAAFGINKFYYLQLKKIDYIFIKSLFLTIYYLFFLRPSSFDKFVDTFSLNNIYCGDLIWDTFIRHNHSFENPKINLKFIKILFVSIYKNNFLKNLFIKNNIKVILTSANNYSTLSAFSLRFGVKFKIKTFFQKFHKVVRINKFDDIRKSPFQLSEKSINEKYKTKQNIIFEKYLFNRMNAKNLPLRVRKNTIDVISAYKNKIKDENYFFNLIKKNKKNFKSINVYAPHAFSDCNHVFGRLLYRDYFQNFLDTLKIIQDDNVNLWIIKPHPSSYLFKEDGLVERHFNQYKKENIILCPPNISTSLVLKIADKIVTSRGTIGLEAACLGKKAILTGSSPYSHLGLSLNPKNIQSYRKLLLSKKAIKKLAKEKQLLAKKYLYWLGKDRMYDELYFIENKWNEKNSFMKNLVKLQVKSTYKKKLDAYFNYVDLKF